MASHLRASLASLVQTKRNTASGIELLSFLVLDAQANLQTVDLSEINADIALGFFFF